MKYVLIFSLLMLACGNSTSNKSKADSTHSVAEQNPIEIQEVTSEIPLTLLLKQSAEQSKIPILYFHADWCKPCVNFKKAMHDERLSTALANAMLIGVDTEADAHNLVSKYGIRAIPTFIKLAADATVIAKITSGKWEEDIPENIAPVMDKLINQSSYDKK